MVFALVLVGVQAFLAMHQVEHWDHPEEATACELCLPGSGLDHGDGALAPLAARAPGAQGTAVAAPAPPAQGTFIPRRARGPPTESFPA